MQLFIAFTETQNRIFLLPPDTDLPAGDFSVYSHEGTPQKVDETWLKTFEVTKAKAQVAIDADLQKGLALTRQALLNQATLLTEEPTRVLFKAESSPEQPRQESPLFRDLLGFGVEDVRQNPDLVKDKIDDLFQGITNFFADSTSEDPEKVENARQQMRDLRTTFADHDIATTDKMEQIPDKLQEAVKISPAERNKRIATALQQLADQIQKTAVAASEELMAEAAQQQNEENNK